MRKLLLCVLAVVLIGPVPVNATGIPVIDAAAVLNLVKQILYWRQQLAAMQAQLNQLQSTYDSMNGPRGMDTLLPTSPQQRNYLPTNVDSMMGLVDGRSGGYAGLADQVRAAMAGNAVLSDAQLAEMSPPMREQVERSRRLSATTAAMSQAAYQNTSQRFAALEQLITAIGGAGDPKAIQDLQGRIEAEQVMLTNEQTKLQVLADVARAEELTQQQRVREQIISGHGGFSSRFVPQTP